MFERPNKVVFPAVLKLIIISDIKLPAPMMVTSNEETPIYTIYNMIKIIILRMKYKGVT